MVFLALESVTNRYNLYVPYEPYTPSELSAMAYHGVIRPQFGPYYVDQEVPDTPAQRAKAVRMAGEQLIIGEWTANLLTAAWIHLGGQAPEMLEAGTATHQRTRLHSRIVPTACRQMDYLQRHDIADDDLLIIGGVVVTNIEVTIEDLVCFGGTPRHVDRARQLASWASPDVLRERFLQNQHFDNPETVQQHLEKLLPIKNAAPSQQSPIS